MFNDTVKQVWTRRVARLAWFCCRCGRLIPRGESYNEGVVGGSGVRGMIHCDRLCQECFKMLQAGKPDEGIS
jgi:hypothetical protein